MLRPIAYIDTVEMIPWEWYDGSTIAAVQQVPASATRHLSTAPGGYGYSTAVLVVHSIELL